MMAPKGGFIDFSMEDHEPDPAVQSLITGNQARQAAQQLPAKERKARTAAKKKDKERKAKGKERGIRRTSLDLPEDYLSRATLEAEELGCPISQVVAALMAAGLAALDAGDLDLDEIKRVNPDSRRYDHDLDYGAVYPTQQQRGTPKKTKGHP